MTFSLTLDVFSRNKPFGIKFPTQPSVSFMSKRCDSVQLYYLTSLRLEKLESKTLCYPLKVKIVFDAHTYDVSFLNKCEIEKKISNLMTKKSIKMFIKM